MQAPRDPETARPRNRVQRKLRITMRSVGIVCGYDLNDDLPGYVSSIAPLIGGEDLDLVILSGGRTSPHLEHSEAAVMAEHLRYLLPAQELVLEEHAMTTLENLLFARDLAERHGSAVTRFVVFCDRVHRRKVAALAKVILGASVTVHCVDRNVPMRERIFEPASHLIEAVVARMPRLRKYLRAAAMRIKGVKKTAPALKVVAESTILAAD